MANMVSTTIPTDYTAEAAAIERKRQLAQLLQQQSMQPLDTNQQAGGMTVPISWTQGLAKMLQAYSGAKGQSNADTQTKELATKYQTELADTLRRASEAATGTPAQAPLTPNDDNGNPMPGVAARAPNMMDAANIYMQHPATQALGMQAIQQDMQRKATIAALTGQGMPPPSGGAQTAPTQAGGASVGGPAGGVPMAAWLQADPSGKSYMEALAKENAPQNVRPGGTIAQRGPDGNWTQGYYSGQVGQGMTRAPNGSASVIPGYLEGQSALGNTPLQQVTNNDQTISFIPRSQLTAAAQAAPQPAATVAPTVTLRDIVSIPDARERAAALQAYESRRAPGAPVTTTASVIGTPPRFGQNQEQQIEQARLTAAGKTVDEAFGKDYVPFVTGGAQDAAKQLSQLKDVTTALSTPGSDLTGSMRGMLPDVVRNQTNPQAVAMRERVEEVVQRSLRAILGAQFTEKEGERLISRAYNPQQSPQENAIRVGRLYQQLSGALDAKQQAAQYFEKHGTLQGWKGKLPSIADFDQETASKPNAAPSGQLTPQEQKELNALRQRFGSRGATAGW